MGKLISLKIFKSLGGGTSIAIHKGAETRREGSIIYGRIAAAIVKWRCNFAMYVLSNRYIGFGRAGNGWLSRLTAMEIMEISILEVVIALAMPDLPIRVIVC